MSRPLCLGVGLLLALIGLPALGEQGVAWVMEIEGTWYTGDDPPRLIVRDDLLQIGQELAAEPGDPEKPAVIVVSDVVRPAMRFECSAARPCTEPIRIEPADSDLRAGVMEAWVAPLLSLLAKPWRAEVHLVKASARSEAFDFPDQVVELRGSSVDLDDLVDLGNLPEGVPRGWYRLTFARLRERGFDAAFEMAPRAVDEPRQVDERVGAGLFEVTLVLQSEREPGFHDRAASAWILFCRAADCARLEREAGRIRQRMEGWHPEIGPAAKHQFLWAALWALDQSRP